jgi:hypothetical protein
MKGTSCGKRVLRLVALVAVATVVAPAVAQADPNHGGRHETASPSPTPAAPNVAPPPVASQRTPSTPAPAPASAPRQAARHGSARGGNPERLSAPRIATTRIAKKALKASQIVSNTHVSVSNGPDGPSVAISIPYPTATARPTSGSASSRASLHLKPAPALVAKAVSLVDRKGTGRATKKVAGVAKKHAGARVPADGGDDPMSGCESGSWMTCSTVPMNFTMDNRCVNTGEEPMPPPMNGATPSSGTSTTTVSGTSSTTTGTAPPPGGAEMVTFTNGTETTWTRERMGTVDGMPAVIMDVKIFARGFDGMGIPSGAEYNLGHDFQDTFTITAAPDSSSNKRTQEILMVDSGLAPSMVYSEHDVLSIDNDTVPGTIKFTVSWRIVCHLNEKADNDPDVGPDHDRSGDLNKYKHNHQYFYGYNDDPITVWDQND